MSIAKWLLAKKLAGGGSPFPPVIKRVTGNPVEFTDGADAPLVKCVTEITGSQDLHGYDKPWVGGAGKNKLPLSLDTIKSLNGTGTWNNNVYSIANGTVTVNIDDGGNITSISLNGTFNQAVAFYFVNGTDVLFTSGQYTINGISGGSDSTYMLVYISPSWGYSNLFDGETVMNLNVSRVRISIVSGYTANNLVIKPMVRLATETDSTFTPYTNICPITAYTEGEIEVSDGDGNVTTHTTTYPSAIYRGSEDCVKGEVITEWGMIASYNGETLPGEWISDRDEYAPGTTPTTGAQVAYKLAAPTTSPVTPTNLPIKSLSGYNHIESSTGDMEIDYITDAYQNFVDTVESALPNTTRNLLTASKGGTKAMDIFLSLEKRDDKEEEVKEETKDDMR